MQPTNNTEAKRIIKFVYIGELPNLNEQISAAQANKFKYAKYKRNHTEGVCWEAKRQLRGIKLTTFAVVCRWYVKSQRIDPDNTAFAIKYILDGLQWAGVIEGDGFKQVSGGIVHQFAVDKNRPRVEVFLLENHRININFE